MINPKEDANQGNNLLCCCYDPLNSFTFQVCDISEVVPQLPLDDVRETFNMRERNDSNLLDMLRILASLYPEKVVGNCVLTVVLYL
ncbi:hypothetical protein CK203_060250 [Vitis vinifera]|uniref:Uncharacterized protein n=1 Tax=Vitis vinifera TaxID=29760 RepID=A0A438GLR0_VITVI|nr:hypothetical protein CK203_060250 [Vitis vinifera]